MQKDIILLWIQWSGKGTQAKLLREVLPSHMYYEMGNTLRALMSNDNLIGNYISGIVDRWAMVDNHITHYLILISLNIAKGKNEHLIIDGFPRVMEQANFFVEKEAKLERDYVVIQYVLSREEAIKRMMNRAKIEARDDDTLEVMNKRISIFESETTQVLEYFDSIGKLIKINADASIEEVFEDTKKALWL